MSFSSLGLSDNILKGIRAMGYEDPTPIQLRGIPLFLEGRDLIGSAQTGTGKTAAFGLPILTKLDKPQKNPRALIVEPTRELASQVETAFRDFSQYSDLRTTVIYGGVKYGKQNDELERGTDIIVATPGRLLDHVSQKNLTLKNIEYLVLDEADRMLDMGFMPDVKRIIQHCPEKRHTSLFSATIPPVIETIIQWAMTDPETVEIGMRRSVAETVSHAVYPVAFDQKNDLVLALLDKVDYDSVIVFCRTKMGADRLGSLLKRENHSVAILHSDRTQSERERSLEGFRDGKYKVLVATDIASRGLDVANVSHVVNFDVPQHPEDYVHRIGRTGRAAASGDAFTMMVAEDRQHMEAIERFIGKKINREKMEGFDYKYTSLFDDGKHASPPRFRGGSVGRGYSFGMSSRKGGGRRKRR
jgi:ATP-dependent RNA helicase RhlE